MILLFVVCAATICTRKLASFYQSECQSWGTSRQHVQAWASCRAVPLLMRVLSPEQVQAGRLNWMQSYMQDLGLTACAGMCAAG